MPPNNNNALFLPQKILKELVLIRLAAPVSHFYHFCSFVCFFFLFKLFHKGDKSNRPTQWEEEQFEQLSEREGAESERPIEAKKIEKIISKRERKQKEKQKESEELQKKMIEEWEEMKPQLQDLLNTKESKYQLAKIIGIRLQKHFLFEFKIF